MTRICINMGLPMPGDILITRWDDEDRNRTPGFWNHAAIFVGNNQVIEAVDKKGVITMLYPEFLATSDKIKAVRLMIGESNRMYMAQEAVRYIGTPYRQLSSIFFRLFRRSVNCTSLIRKCYIKVMRSDPIFKIPDDIFNYHHIIHWRVR